VKLWAYRACFWFRLEGFIIFESSRIIYVVKHKRKVVYQYVLGRYLVVFNRPVRWKTNDTVMNWVALESGNEGLQRYVRMHCIKKASTIRFTAKGDKPSPRIVFRYGKQDKQIWKLLETRRTELDYLKQIAFELELEEIAYMEGLKRRLTAGLLASRESSLLLTV
jgi:hypothetical protein